MFTFNKPLKNSNHSKQGRSSSDNGSKQTSSKKVSSAQHRLPTLDLIKVPYHPPEPLASQNSHSFHPVQKFAQKWNRMEQKAISLRKPVDIQREAAKGVRGAGQPLPYFDRIQQAFGQHDISQIKAYTGSEAKAANKSIGAKAYATGNKIAFAESSPNLHTVAHETAHIVQQQKGVRLEDGVGKANDKYEQQAEKLATSVTRNHNISDSLSNPLFKSVLSTSSFDVRNMSVQMMQLKQDGSEAGENDDAPFDTEVSKGGTGSSVEFEYRQFIQKRERELRTMYGTSFEVFPKLQEIRRNTLEALQKKSTHPNLSEDEKKLLQYLKETTTKVLINSNQPLSPHISFNEEESQKWKLPQSLPLEKNEEHSDEETESLQSSPTDTEELLRLFISPDTTTKRNERYSDEKGKSLQQYDTEEEKDSYGNDPANYSENESENSEDENEALIRKSSEEHFGEKNISNEDFIKNAMLKIYKDLEPSNKSISTKRREESAQIMAMEKEELTHNWDFLRAIYNHSPTSSSNPPSNTDLLDLLDVLEDLFRAVALGKDKSVPRLEDLLPETAHSYISNYKKSLEQGSSEKQPIVPMAGFVKHLLSKHSIPLSEIWLLLPHVKSYVKFHKKYLSWTKDQAEYNGRINALNNIVGLLNGWAVDYMQPELYRGPSQIEFLTRQSPLYPYENIAREMRSVITINPGNSVGYEPKEYKTWEKFNERIPGFVRAHLLNKHIHGPGTPENLGLISSPDNILMSQLGEEEIKRMVLEQNKQVFYQVKMEPGMPDSTSSTDVYNNFKNSIHNNFKDSMVKKIHMLAQEVTPEFSEGQLAAFQQGEDFLANEKNRSHLNSEGGITMHTSLPDEQTLGTLQHNWHKRIKTMQTNVGQHLIASYNYSKNVMEMIKDARRNIHNSPGSLDNILLLMKDTLTEEGLNKKEIKQILSDLMEGANQEQILVNTNKNKRKKMEDDVPSRLAQLKKAGINITDQKILQKLFALSKVRFEKYINLRTGVTTSFKMNHDQAFNQATTHGNTELSKLQKAGNEHKKTIDKFFIPSSSQTSHKKNPSKPSFKKQRTEKEKD